MPIGGEPIKYEMDKAAGTLVVDRFLYTAMRYPGNYGFIPHTLSGDGDPCDVLVANTRAIVPGRRDERAPGRRAADGGRGRARTRRSSPCPRASSPRATSASRATPTCPTSPIQQIEHFFEHYKDLEPGKWVKIVRWGDAEDAKRLIEEGIERAKAKG